MNNGVGAESAGRHGLVVLERLHVWQHGEQLGVAAERRRLLVPREPARNTNTLRKRTSLDTESRLRYARRIDPYRAP